jgi:dTDP-4-amino-4,6-dideoxygalactose transaminase
MPIQPADPRSNYLARRDEVFAAFERVLNDGHYILGPEVSAFEAEFAAYVGASQGVGVASGTDALRIGLTALGVGQGDAVLTVSHTAVATVAAIEMAGATPVLVDIDEDSFCMSADSLEETIAATPNRHRLKAIMPVHLYGQPADMTSLFRIAARNDLLMLEDCAQAHGAESSGRKAGSFGDAAAFSFYPTKNLGALGDGGLLVTSRDDVAEQARLTREYGWRQRYVSDKQGVNSRLDELQAALLRVMLRHLDEDNARRRQIAAAYDTALAGTSLVLPRPPEGSLHVYHQYVVRSPQRDPLRSFLSDQGINTLIHYPVPVHMQPAYQGRITTAPGGLPITERICSEILSLPMHPQLGDDDVAAVCDALRRFEGSD